MQFKRQKSAAVEVNLTPLIDVVFLLLIFFMVSTSFSKATQLTLTLPEAIYAAEFAEDDSSLSVIIDQRGNYRIDDVALTDDSYQTLSSALKNLASGNVDRPIEIYADANAPYEKVVRFVDIAGKQGFLRINLITQQSDGEQ